MQDLETQLLNSYGPLLTLQQLAALLHRSQAGLAWSLAQEGELSEKFNRAKVRLGRRVYFRASEVAEALS